LPWLTSAEGFPLKRFPTDVAAIRMLAEGPARIGRFREAKRCCCRCLELAPGFHAARHNYVNGPVSDRASGGGDCRGYRLLKSYPHYPGSRNLNASC